MTVWKPAKGYETEFKVSSRCGIKTMKNKAVATTGTGVDKTFVDNDGKTVNVYELAVATFGEAYVHVA